MSVLCCELRVRYRVIQGTQGTLGMALYTWYTYSIEAFCYPGPDYYP